MLARVPCGPPRRAVVAGESSLSPPHPRPRASSRPPQHHHAGHRLTALARTDAGCRTTLFNAVPQTAAEYLPRLIGRGAQHLRVEFLDDSPEAVQRTLGLYADALNGRREPKTLWRELKAMNHYGVTRGQLAVI